MHSWLIYDYLASANYLKWSKSLILHLGHSTQWLTVAFDERNAYFSTRFFSEGYNVLSLSFWMPYDFIVWRQSWADWLAGTSCRSRQNNIDLQEVIFIELIELNYKNNSQWMPDGTGCWLAVYSLTGYSPVVVWKWW